MKVGSCVLKVPSWILPCAFLAFGRSSCVFTFFCVACLFAWSASWPVFNQAAGGKSQLAGFVCYLSGRALSGFSCVLLLNRVRVCCEGRAQQSDGLC